jgi:hypothetical protein
MKGATIRRVAIAASLIAAVALIPTASQAAPNGHHVGDHSQGVVNNASAVNLDGLIWQLRGIASNIWAMAGASIEVNGVHGNAGASIEVNGAKSQAGASIEVNGVHSDAGASIEVNGVHSDAGASIEVNG